MILGIDPGERRVGLALADLETSFARPLEVIDSNVKVPLERIIEVIAEEGITQIVVGRPVALSGIDGPAVEALRGFLDQLRTTTQVPVDVYDERMTTVMAERQMREAGASAEKRKAMRDAVAAQVMLQGYLDSKR
ncbi:MAG: Holliday junction resolvase RuvX [Actinobacteria bacterium]|nr:Holliday junction resolvase RuvX [Actinomycetota bacterium]